MVRFDVAMPTSNESLLPLFCSARMYRSRGIASTPWASTIGILHDGGGLKSTNVWIWYNNAFKWK